MNKYIPAGLVAVSHTLLVSAYVDPIYDNGVPDLGAIGMLALFRRRKVLTHVAASVGSGKTSPHRRWPSTEPIRWPE